RCNLRNTALGVGKLLARLSGDPTSRSMAHVRNRYLFCSDLLLLAVAPFAAYAIRLEGLAWNATDSRAAWVYASLSLALKVGLFLPFGMYSRLWRHAGIPDMAKIIEATATSTVACAILGLFVLPASGLVIPRVPISVVILDAFLTVLAVAAPRLLIRAVATLQRPPQTAPARRVLIVGAGAAGEMILRELRSNPQLGLTPVGFVDDDPRKRNARLNDVPVLGPLSRIPALIGEHGVDEIVIAIPT